MKSFVASLLLLSVLFSSAQNKKGNLVYVDKGGVLRYTKDKTEAAFFGVNYTVPFAYGYRSHKALGVDIEKAIDADVYHMARLGLDAFRVHVWDVEISDSLGNLLANEHLRLFDYLLKKLKEHKIKILITPIAFWGNGYPEPDVRTNGFSYVYTKGGSVVREEAFKAQENYLRQFFSHVNPYTKLTYRDDPDVIAMEINNEPHHSGPKERTTEYVNRMAAAVRSTGWTKPVFYNVSESPSYADAVVRANVDGHSFQWYPTALVAGHERKGNFLPNVDVYRIPFLDTILAFKNRARMVYEFDAGDVMQPTMYPAMARSFRTAGFQWATQFAYDPMATAYGNTEYQTHYLNLIYTPAKAISLLIASKAFHRLPRGKRYGAYPADTLFDVFRVSYKEQLSEMNSDEEFYYTGNTSTQPKNPAKLKRIAGVGSSPVVRYDGTGAYFLDKMADGVWRLEVMPDVAPLNDPFEKASPKKAVRRVVRAQNKMQLLMSNRSGRYFIKGLNDDNDFKDSVKGNSFLIKPGVYEVKSGSESVEASSVDQRFFVPAESLKEPVLLHQPLETVSPNKAFRIEARVAGVNSVDKIYVELRNSSNKWKTVTMWSVNDPHQSRGLDYRATVPEDMVAPGIINYRIILKKGWSQDTFSFPGGFKGNPYAWDEYRNETYQTFVAAPDSPLELFNPSADRNRIALYNPDWRNNTVEYITAGKPFQLVLKATLNKPAQDQLMGWQHFFGDKISGRKTELSSFTKLVIRARASQELRADISLITAGADAYASGLALTKDWKEIEIPLSSLQKDSMLLLPRPYPGFQPLWFLSADTKPFALGETEGLEIRFGGFSYSAPVSVEVESVWLKK